MEGGERIGVGFVPTRQDLKIEDQDSNGPTGSSPDEGGVAAPTTGTANVFPLFLVGA